MNKLLFYTAILVGLCTSCTSSTYNEEEEAKNAENQQKRELIVGKWACRRPGTYSGYDLYVFRADETGIAGQYDDPRVTQFPTLDFASFRYAIFNGEITFCYDYWNHTHPMLPGEICESDPLSFVEFTVDDVSLKFNEAGKFPYTRVSKWSDVGLPDDLLPE